MKNPALLISIVFLSSMLLFGCLKDIEAPEPQISTPAEYFPAYLSSWWEYRDYNNDIVKYEISSTYTNCEGIFYPTLLNNGLFVKDSSFWFGHADTRGVYISSPIYSLREDIPQVCPVSFSTFQICPDLGPPVEDIPYRRILVKKDTNIYINGESFNEVIIMKEYSLHDSLHIYYDYFARFIGLIKRDSIAQTDSTLNYYEILSLIDYYVAD